MGGSGIPLTKNFEGQQICPKRRRFICWLRLRLCGIFAVLVHVIFFMDRSTNDSLEEQRINLDAMMAKRVPILLEFGKGWCRPCKYMKPILEDMAKEYGDKAIVATVDMDANYDLVRGFGVRVMPTQVFLHPEGKEFFRNEGVAHRLGSASVRTAGFSEGRGR